MSSTRRSLLLAFASVAAIVAAEQAGATYIPYTLPQLNAVDYNIKGDGVTNDAAAINNFLLNCSNAGAAAYFPGGKNYNLGSSALTVPDGTTVFAAQNATFTRSSDPGSGGSWSTNYNTYTGSMISLGNHCRWSGGIFNNTAQLATSTTSVNPSTLTPPQSVTFTINAAGLNLVGGSVNFIRIQSASVPSAHMEGLVTTYSGTSLTVNVGFAAGSGTHTDWIILAASVYQAPMVLHGVTESIVENVRVTGNWYVGLLMDGWNVNGGSSVPSVSFCTFRNCYAEAVMNRGLYLYGGCNDNLISECYVDGRNGFTDYGVNLNPANAVGTTNVQLRNKIAGCSVNTPGFQGFELGDQSFYNTITGCTAYGVTNTVSAGFLIQQANTSVPQYNELVNCVANNCAGVGFEFAGTLYGGATRCAAILCKIGFEITSQGGSTPSYISLTGCEADASTTIGFWLTGSAVDCDLTGIKAISNGTNGIQVDSGCTNTLITGRSVSNTSSNLVNNGTGTVSTGLVTV
ncbi:hypothetical protein H8A95_21955 [Bradyrhizobium sp. Pear76]|uniref:glycoside hydrolase family 55 protein n=1 Tax=Bradyrhizobium oropedii TaxID=1571201 RepID=UPI001E5A5526|nr:glycoside hydrolase family 55 protein [Bradyrhizobium oropedii]MCC8964903.1 hypothetical protein [Bradyrhizobium oropedii]